MPRSERRQLVDKADPQFPVAAQCAMLGISRSLFYHRPKGVSQTDLDIMARMDRMVVDDPTRGSRRWRRDLALEGIRICRAKARRLMRIMNIGAVGHRKSTTKSDPKAYKYPYLLGGLSIERVNQVWQIDISYIPMRKGYMYLTAIIDVCSRMILSWSVTNTMGADVVVACVSEALGRHGKPEIINSDQGSQFTGAEYVGLIKSLKTTKLSMSSRGRAIDNVYIERFFRSIKYEKLYLFEPQDGKHLFELCDDYIRFYNEGRGHSSIDDMTPMQRYRLAS